MKAIVKKLEPPPRLPRDLAPILRDFADRIERNELKGLAMIVDDNDLYRFIYDDGAIRESIALTAILQHHLLKRLWDEGKEIEDLNKK